MQGDKIDLSKWGIEVTQEGIYKVQNMYSPSIICNLDIPLGPQVDFRTFRTVVEKNIENMKTLEKVVKDDESEIYYVIHGRNKIEIEYMYGKVKGSIDTTSERVHFALGRQVPLVSYGKSIVSENASYLSKLISDDFGNLKRLHLFGVGSSIVKNVKTTIDLSYDNSTYVRNAMNLRWYSPKTHIYENFQPTLAKDCECLLGVCRQCSQVELIR